MTTLHPSNFQKIVGKFSGAEEENHEEIPQEICDDEAEISQKPQKKIHQKYKPEKPQKILKILHCKKNA